MINDTLFDVKCKQPSYDVVGSLNNVIVIIGFLDKNNIKYKLPCDFYKVLVDYECIDVIKFLINSKMEESDINCLISDLFVYACNTLNHSIIKCISNHLSTHEIINFFKVESMKENINIAGFLIKEIMKTRHRNDIMEGFDYYFLYKIAKEDNYLVFELLLEHGINLNGKESELFSDALYNNSIKVVELLFNACESEKIENGRYLNDELNICVTKNFYECVEFLLKNFEFEDEMIDKAFCKCEKCDVEIVQLLVNNHVNIKKYGKILCSKAKKANNHDLVEYLKTII